MASLRIRRNPPLSNKNKLAKAPIERNNTLSSSPIVSQT